jgi:hypothetical protein
MSTFFSSQKYPSAGRTKNPQLVKLSIKGLTSSVEGFENSHEELVEIVNSLAVMLSSVGI